MRPKLVLLTSALALAIGLGACGDSGGSDDAQLSSATGDDANGAAGSSALVQAGQTDLGEVLTTGDGLTLYAFTNDTAGVSTCEGACADAWPPLLVDSDALPAGLDPSVFSVVPRNDGTFQLAAANQPLYRFAGDEAPGDTNGQGSGGVWFAVAPDGQLIQGDGGAADSAGTAETGSQPAEDQGSDGQGSSDDDGGYGY